jgi:hypothetical protein
MATAPAPVHRLHNVLLWMALLGSLFLIATIGLIYGMVFAKAPPDPVALPGRTGQAIQATPGASTNPEVSTATFSVRPAPAWRQVERKDTSLEFTDRSGGGIVFIQSDRRPAEPTAQVITDITSATQRKYPDVRTCVLPTPLSVNGPSGSVFALCYTFIPQSGRAYPAVDLFWVATNGSGSTFYLYEVFAPADSFNEFNKRALGLVQTVSWKLS